MDITQTYRSNQNRIFDAVSSGEINPKTIGNEISTWFLNHTEVNGFFEAKSPEDLAIFRRNLVVVKLQNPALAKEVDQLNKKVDEVAAKLINREYKTGAQTLPSTISRNAIREPRKQQHTRVVERAATTRPPQTSILAPAKATEKAVETSSAPAPVLEKRAPKTAAEEKAVMNYMATEVINKSPCDDKPKLIKRTKILAKNSVYDHTVTNPQSFQGRLAFMHKPSFEAFKKAHPYLF